MKLLLLPVLLPGFLHGATVFTEVDATPGLIPDASFTGLGRSLTFSEPLELIRTVEVNLQLSPTNGGSAYLGDLYVYLTDGTSLVTLMSRPGQAPSLLGGYDDNQAVNVTFLATGASDIHTYREAVTGSAATPLSGALTGVFQADGRTTDPTSVVTGDSRDTSLSDYETLSADRTFTLFVADLSGGGTHQLDSWSVTLVTIPEPTTTLLIALGGLGLLVRRRS